MKASEKTAGLCILFIILLSCSAAAVEVFLDVPAQLNPGAAEQATVTLRSELAFDGLVMMNATNSNVTEWVFGFSRLQFVDKGAYHQLEHAVTLTGGELGPYTLSVKVFNLTGHLFATSNATGMIDNFDKQPPTVLSALPSGLVHTEYVEVIVQTNEPSICRIDQNNVSFHSMALELSGGEYIHTTTLELGRAEYEYYLSCIDSSGNDMSPVIMGFSVDPPPTAVITLSDSSPVKAGVLEITLEASEPLRETPSLRYDYDGSERKTISLSAEQEKWTGFLVIDDTEDQRVGTFHFTAVDLQGDTGTTITDGKVFVVDTEKPPAPQSVKAESSDEGVDIEWYYDGEDADHFRVYRSLSPGVGQANFLKISNQERFTDYDTNGGTTYYYRIAAVDLAENEGPLSDEVSAMSDRPVYEQDNDEVEPPPPPARTVVLSSALERVVNSTLYYLDNVYLDLDWAGTSLEDDLDPDVEQVVSTLGLTGKVDTARSKLTEYQDQLREFWYMDLTEKELSKRINKILERVDELRSITPESVAIVERSSTTQAYEEGIFNEAVNAVLLRTGVTEEERATYTLSVLELLDNIRVLVDIKVVDVKYMDSSHANMTVIDKEISYRGLERLNKVRLVEVIPKDVADGMQDISFMTPGYNVLRDDPVVEWRLDSLDAKKLITYVVSGAVDMSAAKDVSTFVLLEPDQESAAGGAEEEIPSAPTGFTVSDDNRRWFTSTEKLMIIIGLFAALGLMVYYVVFSGTSLEDIMTERYMKSYMRKANRLEGKVSRLELLKQELHQEAHEDDFIATQSLLSRALVHADNGQFGRAGVMYSEIADMYARLPADYKAQLYPECKMLLAKLRKGNPGGTNDPDEV
jgi:hypothetical protein